MHLVLLIIICLVHFSTSIDFNVYINNNTVVSINIHYCSPIWTIPDPQKFVGVTVDISNLGSPNWNGFNLTFVQPLARSFGPTYFRFGGTAADLTIFQENQPNFNCGLVEFSCRINFTISELDELYGFMEIVGWRLIIDLNQMLRTGSNINISQWNSTNAKEFLDYASGKNYDMDFELGNEPEFYSNVFNTSISGFQVANGYQALRNLLHSYNLYKNSIIIGPSLSTGYDGISNKETQILNDFFNNSGGNFIDKLTFHHYYLGVGATLNQFLDPTIFDFFLQSMNAFKAIPRSYNNQNPIWLSETSTATNNGAVNLSDTYVAGFLWLDKLGLSAKNGLEVVLREDFYGKNYALLNKNNRPLPDYWLTLIYKKLIGNQVFNVTFEPSNQYLRLYASSGKNNNGTVIYGVWLSNTSTTINFPNIATPQAIVYILKENELGNLQSKLSTLNGVLLSWDTHQPGPNFQQNLTQLPITLPPYSQFYIVLEEKNLQCPLGWIQQKTTTNKCIRLFNETMPLFGAKFDCGSYGANTTILTISNSFENSEILQQTTASNCNHFYIGLEKNESNWKWSDGNPSTYNNWMNGYPNTDLTQNCVIFDSKTGTWINTDCDQFQCYICQKFI